MVRMQGKWDTSKRDMGNPGFALQSASMPNIFKNCSCRLLKLLLWPRRQQSLYVSHRRDPFAPLPAFIELTSQHC
jgi:hypothetical protein